MWNRQLQKTKGYTLTRTGRLSRTLPTYRQLLLTHLLVHIAILNTMSEEMTWHQCIQREPEGH